MADWRWLDTGGYGTYIDLDNFRFGGDRLRNPAIVIPGRTRRWFHNWQPGVDLIGKPHWPGRMLSIDLPGDPMALYFHVDLSGIPGYIGTQIPRTDSGQYLGIARTKQNQLKRKT